MQYSYWFIPVLKREDWYDVLLVQHLWWHWSFPKGHIEHQETPLQTAKRELFEETGISQIHLLSNLCFDNYYSFYSRNGELIQKKVGFFVGEVYDDTVVLQKEELQSFLWVPLIKADIYLTFESDKKILKQAIPYIS